MAAPKELLHVRNLSELSCEAAYCGGQKPNVQDLIIFEPDPDAVAGISGEELSNLESTLVKHETYQIL